MGDSGQIISKLREIVDCLRANGSADWADGFERMADEFPSDPDETKRQIRGCYGGMGSFNDLVLHKQGVPLRKENDELDRMRHELWELCQLYASK